MVFQVLTSVRFMLLWVLGSLAGLLVTAVGTLIVTVIVSIALGFFYLSNSNPASPAMQGIVMVGFTCIGALLGLVWGSLQKFVTCQKYQVQFRWWRRLSTLGGGIGMGLSAIALSVPIKMMLLNMRLPDYRIFLFYGILPILIPLMCIGIAQFFVLNRYVHGAWAWILANVVGGLVVYALLFGLVTSGIAVLVIPVLFALAAPAIVTGFAMLFLFQFNARSTIPDEFY
jgi:hypothetical protein